MELKALKKDDKTLLLEVKGETFTLTNLVQDELWNDPNVLETTDIKEHPYLEEPKIWVKMERGNPVTAIKKACQRIERKIDEFSREFEKALKEFKS